MIFKILTVVFLTYYIIKIFKQGGLIKSSTIKLLNMFPKTLNAKDIDIYTNELDKENKYKVGKQSLKILVLVGLYIVLMMTEFVYIINSTELNCNKIFVIGYLIFWLFILIVNIVKCKTSKNNLTINETILKLNKYKISQMLINLVDVAYFSYIFYILFI